MSDPFKPCGWPIEPGVPFDLVTRFNADSEADKMRAEITSLRAQLDGMKRAAEVRDGTVAALNETCVNQGFEIADLKAKLDEARAAFTQIREHTKNVVDDDLIAVVDMIAEDFLDPSKRASLRALFMGGKNEQRS